MHQDSRPASRADIAAALAVLFKAMPPARGVAVADRLDGYLVALAEFPVGAINAGIARFLAGKCEGVKTAFCPSPPELAAIVRGASPVSAAPPSATGRRRLYAYRPPTSKIIMANCSKQAAFQAIDAGQYPRGSIWCPGSLNDRPEFGDLYAPDPGWQPAKPLDDGGLASAGETLFQRQWRRWKAGEIANIAEGMHGAPGRPRDKDFG